LLDFTIDYKLQNQGAAKRNHNGIEYRVHTMALVIITLSLLIISPVVSADNLAHLKGYWQRQEDGGRAK
jgi:hypothetical protein